MNQWCSISIANDEVNAREIIQGHTIQRKELPSEGVMFFCLDIKILDIKILSLLKAIKNLGR